MFNKLPKLICMLSSCSVDKFKSQLDKQLRNISDLVFDDIMHLMIGGNTVDMVYLDFAKALDKVDHGVLFHKIKTLGITGKLIVWLYHFLTHRTHFV